MNLTHIDENGKANMVDISKKNITDRLARASGVIKMKSEVIDAVVNNTVKKGDVLSTARIAGIMAIKKTSDLIPLCHSLLISKADIDFIIDRENGGAQLNVIFLILASFSIFSLTVSICSSVIFLSKNTTIVISLSISAVKLLTFNVTNILNPTKINVIVIQVILAIDKLKFLNTPLKDSKKLLFNILNGFIFIFSFHCI